MPAIMVIALQIFGAFIIVAIFIFFPRYNERKGSRTLLAMMIFAALVLMMNDRIAEVTFGGGKFKLLRDRASADAGEIQALKTRVENQSATIDAVAEQAKSAAGLSDKAASQISTADQRLADLNATLLAAKVTLEKMQKDADFGNVIQQAQNDDRAAFDKLSLIAKDQSSPYAKRAAAAQNVIMDAHSVGMFETGLQLPWQNSVDPNILSIDALKSIFGSAAVPLKPALIEFINNRGDIPKLEKLDFFIEVMKTDASLKAVEYAGRYFTMDTNLNIKPFATDYLLRWWSEHRKDYEIPASEQK